MIELGETAKEIRTLLGLSQRAAAEALGVTPVHLCNVERNNGRPSLDLIDRYYAIWSVDLYAMSWCSQMSVVVKGSRKRTLAAIANAYRKQLKAIRLERQSDE